MGSFFATVVTWLATNVVGAIFSALGYSKTGTAKPVPETATPGNSDQKNIGVDETKIQTLEQSNADQTKAAVVGAKTDAAIAADPAGVMRNDPFNLDN